MPPLMPSVQMLSPVCQVAVVCPWLPWNPWPQKKPVIAWDSSVYRQMIKHMENGFLVEENIEELATGIAFILTNKEKIHHFGKKTLIYLQGNMIGIM